MTNDSGPRQRMRIPFAKRHSLKYISHLDLARTWERVFRRARLPLAHSKGFNPRPRFQIAAALPVGVMGREEYLDLWLDETLTPEQVISQLRDALPPGLEVMDCKEVEVRAPSLQSQLRAADYSVSVYSSEPPDALRARVKELLEAQTLPRQRQHKGRWQTYDLRPLIQSIVVEALADGAIALVMRLQASPGGAGRPDEVLDVLGLSLASPTMERTKLHFEFDN